MKSVNMLEGPIARTLAKLALPIMASSVIQMGYNLVDMFWVGRLGSGAVAAVGAAGMYMWLGSGLATIPKMGGQVLTGQKLGENDPDGAANFAAAALRMAVLFGVVYGLLSVLFDRPLIAFYGLSDPDTIAQASAYHMITSGLVVFSFLGQVLGGLFTAMGHTIINLRVTAIGMVLNMVLDPLLIFGIGPVPGFGAAGAAAATVFSQFCVFALYLFSARKDKRLFHRIRIFSQSERGSAVRIVRIGLPSAAQDCIFSLISMTIARIIAGWGDGAIAAQKVGTQVESISFMISGGFATAINAFTAQNFGAGRYDRIQKGFSTGAVLMVAWGAFTSVVLIAFPEPLMRLFIQEADVVEIGASYLRIMGLAEIFSCLEGLASGMFQGMGHTVPPAVTGMAFNLFRIPAALLLSATALGLSGIWWAMSLSMFLKGVVLPIWFILFLRRFMRAHKAAPAAEKPA